MHAAVIRCMFYVIPYLVSFCCAEEVAALISLIWLVIFLVVSDGHVVVDGQVVINTSIFNRAPLFCTLHANPFFFHLAHQRQGSYGIFALDEKRIIMKNCAFLTVHSDSMRPLLLNVDLYFLKKKGQVMELSLFCPASSDLAAFISSYSKLLS